jgi:hypothetical protein
VYWDRGKWVAYIRVNGNRRHLGRFDAEEDAALAYSVAATEAWGERANLNVLAS